MKQLTILILFFLSFNLSAQTTWFVSTNGADTNSGTNATNAFATINKAINVSNCGDSIYVLGGVYHEKINAYTVCPENDRLIIQGDISSRPLIIGDSLSTNKYAISASGDGYRFRHFELTSPYPEICSQSNQVIVGNGDNFDFIDVIVRNSGYDGVKTYGDCSSSDFAVNWRIINSQIVNNGLGCPTSILNGDGIDFTGCKNCIIKGSQVKNNRGHQIQVKLESYNVTLEDNYIEGINLLQIGLPGLTPQCDSFALNADSIFIRYNTFFAKGDTSGFVIKLADVSNLYIENNTIIKDSISNIDVGFICFGECAGNPNWMNYPQSPVIIRNNIFYSMADVPFYYGADTTFFDPSNILNTEITSGYNLFFDKHGKLITPVDGSLTSFVSNPLFCNYPVNFELSGTSPCIDSGDPTSNQDPDLSQNDIGAFYYHIPCFPDFVESENPEKINIYPNPSSGYYTIQVSDLLIGGKVKIYNILNQFLLSTNINSKE
ncbi:MAG: hypothetical protein GXO79_03895, partial [Chlorobi bacterium]|nr:hypothetical protein [Chlorobiota bacterium]